MNNTPTTETLTTREFCNTLKDKGVHITIHNLRRMMKNGNIKHIVVSPKFAKIPRFKIPMEELNKFLK